MARNREIVTCKPGQWTELTNADATAITFQATSGDTYIALTDNATAPTGQSGIRYPQGTGEVNRTVADLSETGTPVRLWGRGAGSTDSLVYVDHA